MTRSELIDEGMERRPHLMLTDGEVIVETGFRSMVEALAKGERIAIRGFRSYPVKHRPARD